MSTNKISKIRVKGIDYEVKDKKQSGVNTITSLTSIPNTKEQVIANLSGPTEFSLSAMEPGDSIEVTCIPSKDFKQSVTGDNIKTTFDGKKIKAKQNTPFKIYTDCYKTNNIIVDTDADVWGGEYYILVSTSSDGSAELLKYTNPNGSSTESISIPASSTDYEVDGLIYGFRTTDDTGGLKITSLDLSNFDTSNVTSMNDMFGYCIGLTSLDLSSFDTSKVTIMSGMFQSCIELTSLDLSNFDTSNVTSMQGMFMGCSGLTSLDLSSFDTSNVTNVNSMFMGCSGLTSLDLSSFDTSNMTNVNSMFTDCSKLNHIKCKQAFKDWCWSNPDDISLPSAMRSGGSGTWEIVS